MQCLCSSRKFGGVSIGTLRRSLADILQAGARVDSALSASPIAVGLALSVRVRCETGA